MLNTNIVHQAQTIPHVLSAMSRHPLCAELQAEACNALRGLAWSEPAERRIVELGGLDLVFAALHNHSTDADVQKHGGMRV